MSPRPYTFPTCKFTPAHKVCSNMRYTEIKPTNALARFVECFWTLEDECVTGPLKAEPIQAEPILPDGCVELILNFGAHFEEFMTNGHKERQPNNIVVGQMTRPVVISPTGSVQLLGIRFHPGGTFPFFRVPMEELTNRVTALGEVTAEFERDLIARVDAAPSSSQRTAAVERLLSERVRNSKYESWVPELATRIVQCGGRVSMDALATAAGVSGRQLERRFLRDVGIGPKSLCRILRFQQVFQAFQQKTFSWAAVAADCGYYDQAHLIRDFQQFAGQTPASLLENSSALTESFTRKNRRSDFSNTPA